MSEENRNIQISRFVGRIKEIGDIEKCLREQECKVIILSGFFGIGKTLLTIRSLKFLYNNSSNYKVIDFSRIPGLAELSLEFANKLNKDLVNDNKTREQQEKT